MKKKNPLFVIILSGCKARFRRMVSQGHPEVKTRVPGEGPEVLCRARAWRVVRAACFRGYWSSEWKAQSPSARRETDWFRFPLFC